MNVLPQDRKLAAELYECCHSCLDRARMELRNDNIDAADRWVKEYQLCKRDLDKLVRRKKEHDRLVQIVRDMQKKGVDLTIVERGIET